MSRFLQRFFGGLCLATLSANAWAQDFEIYAVDVGVNRNGPYQVVKYDGDGTNPEVFIDEQLSRPQDILFLEDQGVALVSNLSGNRITRHDASTGEYIDDFASNLGQPTRTKIGADNLLYVLQWAGNGRVLRYDLDGNFVDQFTSVGVSNSIGMDWDSGGNLYVASFDQANVRKFGPSGEDLGLFVTTNLSGPTNIWFADDGNLVVVDWSGRAIRRFDASGNFISTLVTGLNEPEGVEFLSNGDFLLGNGGTSAIKQYTANGTFIKDLVASGSGGLVKPNAVRLRESFAINRGIGDAWFNQQTAGQGLFITVLPDTGIVFLAWFTYDTERPAADVEAALGEPGHRWLTAQGPFEGNTATLEVFLTEGGVFNMAQPAPTTGAAIGTITIVWQDCESGTLSFDLTEPTRTGQFPIRRVAPDNVSLCETLSEQ